MKPIKPYYKTSAEAETFGTVVFWAFISGALLGATVAVGYYQLTGG